MLLELNIKNFAIIDNLNVNFSEGFNVFTGETGAGKSIIIDAMNIVLGGRATREYIRSGTDKSVIEALFNIEGLIEVNKILKEFGIDNEFDCSLLITREIYASGKTITRVNGRTVTLSMLNNITKKLVEIHGQHEHQSLLSSDNHIRYIDSMDGLRIEELKQEIYELYENISSLKGRLKELSYDDMERERKLDLLKFQIEEVSSAGLKENEEESLINQYNIYSNTEEIIKTVGNVVEVLSSNDYNNSSIIDQLNHVSSSLKRVSAHDKNLTQHHNTVKTVIYQLQDIVRELRLYEESIEFEPDKLKMIEDRIDLINRLKRKYGNTVSEILQYEKNINEELEFIINSEKEVNKLEKQISEIETKIYKASEKLTIERQKTAKILESGITKELEEMNMSNVTFKVHFEKLQSYARNGVDKVEFLISTNQGEPVKHLSKIASGGEMSRIMLAFKTMLAELDNIPCLIFDEIDTGISGRTAQIVGEKIARISKSHQILCVTHLPQIASIANEHFLIEKKVKDKNTLTKVKKIEDNERIDELSRLLGGVNLTDITRKHAKEMLDMAKTLEFR